MEKNTHSGVRAVAERLNETHDPELRSFVESANDPATDFPLQNLPFAVFRRIGTNEPFRVAAAIGDQVLDISKLQELFDGSAREAAKACSARSMNALMDLGPAHWSALRLGLSRILRDDSKYVNAVNAGLIPIREAEFGLPVRIGNFSDYAASLHHVAKVSKIALPEKPELDPNLAWSPIAYHHRPSSIRPDGHSFLRPKGQLGRFKDGIPVFGPCEKLDYEAELGHLYRQEHGFRTDLER